MKDRRREPARHYTDLMTRDKGYERGGWDRNDASVRGDNDPPTRGRPLKALEDETELEFQRLEARNTGGAEHQTRDERQVRARHQ
jgi:hypothetical protein